MWLAYIAYVSDNGYNEIAKAIVFQANRRLTKYMRICVIGAPIDLGADRRGVDIGPRAIRYAGLHKQLLHLGHTVHDIGNLTVPQADERATNTSRLKYLEPIIHTSEELSELVTKALEVQEFPLILGGDHSVALGSISGIACTHPQV